MSSLLDRETSLAQTHEIRALGGPVLRRVVDEAVGIFERCSQTGAGADENLGILMPFHHAIEMLDGVEVLLDRSCVVASYTPLRSAFEVSLAVRYVLAGDIKRRALSYVVGDTYEWIHWYEEHDPESNRGKQFISEMGLAEGSDFPMSNLADAEPLKTMLAREPFAPIAEEYKRVSRKTSGRVKWYSLFGGPKSVKDLAGSLGQLDDYLIFYREMSKTVHGTDLSGRLITAQDGTSTSVSAVRSPIGMPRTYALSIYIGSEVSKAIMEHYRPDELTRLAKWYLEEVNPVVEKLSQIEEEVAASGSSPKGSVVN